MPGKHSVGVVTSGFFGFSPTRSRIAGAVGVIGALVVGSAVWALTSSPDESSPPSLIVIPTAALSAPPAGVGADALLGEASPSPSPTPSASPSGSATVSPTASPTPKPSTTSAKPPSPDRPAAPNGLAARYVLGSSWNDGFVANVVINNNTSASANWQIRLTYPADVKIAVTGFWNATASVSGTTLILDGGPLAADGQVQSGFQATKDTERRVDPTACTIDGAPCAGF